MQQQPQGYQDAIAAVQAHTSQRAREICELERWVRGTQYDHLPDWFSQDRPLFERAPCIVYPATQIAISSHSDLLLGEGRMPAFKFGDESASKDAEAQLQKLLAAAGFQRLATEVLEASMGQRSGVALVGVRKGKIAASTFKAAWCTPELDDDGSVLSLEVKYPYVVEVRDPHGRLACKAMMFRRVVDAASDTTFVPQEIKDDGREPRAWVPDPKRTLPLSFGFCPVVWYPHLRGIVSEARVDGWALHETLLDEIRAHDFAVSQRHRAALYTGDPIIIETGVPKGYNPSTTGPVIEMPATLKGGPSWTKIKTSDQQDAWLSPEGAVSLAPPPSGANVSRGAYVSGGDNKQGRVKSPGRTWTFESKDARCELLTLPPGALDAIEKNADDIRSKLAESFAVVHLNPDDIRFAATLSGKAMRALLRRQLNRADKLRDDFGARFLSPAAEMVVRIVQKIGPAALRQRFAIDQLLREVDPVIDLNWPGYFPPDLDEEQKLAGTVRDDYLEGLITLETAVQRRAASYGIADVPAYVKKLEAEKKKRDQESIELQRSTFEAEGGMAGLKGSREEDDEDDE